MAAHSPSAFAADLPASLLLRYCESAGWPHARLFLGNTTGNVKGARFAGALRALPRDLQDKVLEGIDASEVVAQGGFEAVLWPACGENGILRQAVENAHSNRARALLLYLHNKPDNELSEAFLHAQSLLDCGANRPNGSTWKMYRLGKFSRDWQPDDLFLGDVKAATEAELVELGEPERHVEPELFARPAYLGAAAEDLSYTIIIHVSGARHSTETWERSKRVVRPQIPDRKIILCITPQSKSFDCGWHVANSEMAYRVMLAVAKGVLNQSDDPEPAIPVRVRLEPLASRPRYWVRAPEHRIKSVQVKKLVLRSGPGTATYFVPSRSSSDAYDVARFEIAPGRIRAASLRVVFERGAFGTREKAVTFDLALPNLCNLRNTEPAERHILDTCLKLWGLKYPETEEDQPMALDRLPGPLSSLLYGEPGPISADEAGGLFGCDLDSLVKYGILSLTDGLETIACPYCADAHSVDIRSVGGRWQAFCHVAGPVPLSSGEELAFQMDKRALLLCLSLLLPLARLDLKELETDTLFLIGTTKGAQESSLLFATDLAAPGKLNEVLGALKREKHLVPGLVFAPRGFASELELPRKHVALDIDSVFSFAGGKLSLDDRGLMQALNRKSVPKAPGRPTAKPEMMRIAKLRQRLKLLGRDVKEELSLLKEMGRLAGIETDFPADDQIQYEWLPDYFKSASFPENPKK
jgi:hypothetical protein